MSYFLTGSVLDNGFGIGPVLLCMAASVVYGIGVAAVYMTNHHYNTNFVITLALLPVTVQIIVMIANGNIGAGIAVAGAFTLVRFRSIPGNSRDMGAIFFAMAIGFVTGMGYLFFGLLFLLISGGMQLLFSALHFGGNRQKLRLLRITIPENMDYDGLFDSVFAGYVESAELEQVKTTNMGSLYELTYHIRLKELAATKDFMDALRTLNGNLNISIGREHTEQTEL
ncbi:MAG: DUF4956 domain-containing protein [Treponema sp.]|jgi:hypothetical protein|nr:DUF4956 domain-containing protein [Treponema sp.]